MVANLWSLHMGYVYVVLTKLAPDDLKHMVKFTNGALWRS